jgi:CheY-like chemotaxis protein
MDHEITVLLVEDEWLVRMDLAETLASAGFAVIESSSGEEAVSLLLSGDRIELLVTDIRLLGTMDGWDLARSVRSICPGVPVLYVSANDFSSDLAVDGGEFLSKPALPSAVVGAAMKLVERS